MALAGSVSLGFCFLLGDSHAAPVHQEFLSVGLWRGVVEGLLGGLS